MSTAGISFGGLASGLDTQAIISALLALEQRPITLLESKKQSLTKQKSLFGDLDGLLDKLTSATQKLKTQSSFLAMAATSDNEDRLTVSATSAASPGTHTVEVLNLARAQINRSDGHAAATTQFGTYGEFTLNIGNDSHVITITNPTLQGIADAINATGADVRADVVDTGASTDPFQLVIRSTETGVENGFTLTAVTGDAAFQSLMTEVTTNQLNAEDASIVLNGINIARASNSISGAIAGVTIDLRSETVPPEEVTITISADSEEIAGQIEKFVEAYNEVVDFFAAQNVLNEEGEAQSDLFGDTTLRAMRSSLRSIVGSAVTGTGNEAYELFSQIGIESDRDGKLTFNKSEFEAALGDDESAVANIFVDATNGIAKRLEDQIKIYTDSVDGLIKARLDGFDRRIKQTNDRIDLAERRLEAYEKRLEQQYANLESLLARLQGQGSAVGSIFQPTGQ